MINLKKPQTKKCATCQTYVNLTLTNFIVPLIEDIVALCFPQLDRKGLMYDPFGGRYVNVHEVFKLCAILKPPRALEPSLKM